MFTEHWTKLPYFVRSGSITGQYFKVLSSCEETLDKYERFCPEFLCGTIPSCPFRSREMFLYDRFDEFATQIFLIALVAISRMRNVPSKLERKNLCEILTKGIKKNAQLLGRFIVL